jgi:hypothetical protein
MPKASDRIYASERFLDIPIPEGGVSFGSISAINTTPLIGVGNTFMSGSYDYPTVTITLKGLAVNSSAITSLHIATPKQVGVPTFSFRGETYRLLSTSKGQRYLVAGEPRYTEYSWTGVNINDPKVSIGG